MIQIVYVYLEFLNVAILNMCLYIFIIFLIRSYNIEHEHKTLEQVSVVYNNKIFIKSRQNLDKICVKI